jgi:hypothetical protein
MYSTVTLYYVLEKKNFSCFSHTYIHKLEFIVVHILQICTRFQ